MPSFLVEIPVRVTRDREFGVDHEPTQERAVKFRVEAEDEDDAVGFVGLLLINALEPEEEDTVEEVLS